MMKLIGPMVWVAAALLVGCKDEQAVQEVVPGIHVIMSCTVNGQGTGYDGQDVPTVEEAWEEIQRMRIDDLAKSEQDIRFTFEYLVLLNGWIHRRTQWRVLLTSEGSDGWRVSKIPSPFEPAQEIGLYESHADGLESFNEVCHGTMGATGGLEEFVAQRKLQNKVDDAE